MDYNFSEMLRRIREAKKKSKMTTELISLKSGIPKGTLNKILTGETTEPKIGTMISLSETLGLNIDYIIYGIEHETEKEEPKTAPLDLSNLDIKILNKYASFPDPEKVKQHISRYLDLLASEMFLGEDEPLTDEDREGVLHSLPEEIVDNHSNDSRKDAR